MMSASEGSRPFLCTLYLARNDDKEIQSTYNHGALTPISRYDPLQDSRLVIFSTGQLDDHPGL
jgi:hypothetical protein